MVSLEQLVMFDIIVNTMGHWKAAVFESNWYAAILHWFPAGFMFVLSSLYFGCQSFYENWHNIQSADDTVGLQGQEQGQGAIVTESVSWFHSFIFM